MTISFSRISIGRGGLPRCRECGPSETPSFRPAEEILHEVRSVATDPEPVPGPNVWLSGADCFAHPSLPQLVAGTIGCGVERLRLTTGGAALSVRDNAAGALDAGARHLEVVCLSVDQRRDEKCGLFRFPDVQAGLEAYRAAAECRAVSVAVIGRIAACPHTVDSVPATVAALASSGVVAVTVDCTLMDGPSSAAWARATLDSGVVNRAWVVLGGETGLLDLPGLPRQYRFENVTDIGNAANAS